MSSLAVIVHRSRQSAEGGRLKDPSRKPDSPPSIGISTNRYTLLVHEMGIALEIYRVCQEVVTDQGGGRIDSVRMAIGELSAVEPDLLTFAWEAVVVDGPDAGARLDIDWRPAIQFCSGCDERKLRAEGSWLRICPDCGMPLEVSGGDDLDVLEVTIAATETARHAEDDDG